jgi:hypothetical protein
VHNDVQITVEVIILVKQAFFINFLQKTFYRQFASQMELHACPCVLCIGTSIILFHIHHSIEQIQNIWKSLSFQKKHKLAAFHVA